MIAWLIRKLKTEDGIETLMAIMLALAGAATSWSGYQAALWSGQQASFYTHAGATRQESVRLSTRVEEQQMVDIGIFMQWINAYAAHNEGLQEFHRSRFRPEFVPAFDAWVQSHPKKNPKALPTPFAQPEYKLPLQQEAEKLSHDADELFKNGEQANNIADHYVRDTVTFAMVMFFIGIGQHFKGHKIRSLLALLSVIAIFAGIWHLFAYPIATLD